jgi:DHA3 family macrolide efflux protein-like MFS transporter
MGRVFSVLIIVNGLARPISIAILGPLGDVIQIEWLLIVTGILLALGGVILFFRKELVDAGAPEPPTE